MDFATRLVAHWYRPGLTPLTAALTPFAVVFGALAALRRGLYRAGWLRATHVGVPVVVVGNVTVGGTGKTPLVRALVEALRARGWQPGIVSRGYGRTSSGVHEVRAGDSAVVAGDEPLLLAADGAPVVVGGNRVAAARHLVARHPGVDVIVADDGLQHYALARDLEIVVIDAARGFGNGRLLPAGPLRERAARAAQADARVLNVGAGTELPSLPSPSFRMSVVPSTVRPLRAGVALPHWRELPPGSVHAVAGIAQPERFFAALAALGIEAVAHPFPDHHVFAPQDLAFPGATAILMTEKDAVKCSAFADARMFCLPVRALVDPALVTLVEDILHGRQTARAAGLPRHQGPAHV